MSGGSETSTIANAGQAATTITVKTPIDWGRIAGGVLGGAASAVGSILKSSADKDTAMSIAGMQYNKNPQQSALASQLMQKFGPVNPSAGGPTMAAPTDQPQSIDDLRRRFMAIGGGIPAPQVNPQMTRRV